MKKNGHSNAIKGATGEFFVASYLSALGFVVALPRGGVPSSDLLLTSTNCTKAISLQVKTATKPLNGSVNGKYGKYLSWAVSSKSKSIMECSHWYAFVDLIDWPREGSSPNIYFVPSKDVANLLKTDWNKEGETRLFFSIFLELNENNSKYIFEEKTASYYKDMNGVQGLVEFALNVPQ